ncbi:MAG: hypothetical protein IKT55_07560, partial [Clostridia bacterium]|nr:hypothetical protein [Clostridia bacterium]
CEKVLDIDPENPKAYVGKLMADYLVKKQDDLKNLPEPFNANNNYQKALRFADANLKGELIGYLNFIANRNEQQRLDRIYTSALKVLNTADTSEVLFEVAEQFKAIQSYKDSAELYNKTLKMAEELRKDEIYNKANTAFGFEVENPALMSMRNTDVLKRSAELFRSISGWRDADEKAQKCLETIEAIKTQQEEDRRKTEEFRKLAQERLAKKRKLTKIAISVGVAVICFFVMFAIILKSVIIPNLIYGEETWNKIKNIDVGDTYTFGSYEQDNNTSNGKEDIEWLVLEKQGTQILVISKYALDCKPYNEEYEGVTWETCTLRSWLNDDFINSAFTEEEKAMIPTVSVTADANPKYSTNPGNDTEDKVFLLSINEANEYFSSSDERICQPTAFAVANGAWESDSGNCWWRLRSPGYGQHHATGVYNTGNIDEYGRSVTNACDAVRPAMWIDFAS